MRRGSLVVEAGDELCGSDECGCAVGAEDKVLQRGDGPKIVSGLGAVGELRDFLSCVFTMNLCWRKG